MSYFRNFPALDYYFGNKTTSTRFPNLMVYADLIDQIKDDVSVYTTYNIQDGDRIDQISQKLYGTTDYHWTIFLMNDDLRCHGFPLSYTDLVDKAKTDYPNKVLYTRNDLSTKFKVGTVVTGQNSGAKGTILRRRLDFGQIIISTTDTFIAGETITATENDVLITAKIDAVVLEYNAIHHYTNDSDLYVDVDPTAPFIRESDGLFVLFDSDYKLDTFYNTLSAANTANTIFSSNASDFELYSYYKDYNVIGNSNPLTWNNGYMSIQYADGNSGNDTEIGIPAYTLTSNSTNSNIYTLTNFSSSDSERVFGIWIKRRTGTGTIKLTGSGSTLFSPIFIDITSQVTSEWNFITLPNNGSTQGIQAILLSDVNDQVDIAGPLVYLTPNDYSKFETREVDVYRLIDRNLDLLDSAPIGLTYLNDSGNYETYFNSASSTTYSDSADANTNVENLFDAYIVANYDDIEPSLLTPVTYLERLTDANAEKQQIKVIKPEVIEDVINSFNSIMLDAD